MGLFCSALRCGSEPGEESHWLRVPGPGFEVSCLGGLGFKAFVVQV